MIKNLRKTIAFTLAETLIVIGIIGIVSALTLPNLNASTGEKEKVAQVKKIYQNLVEALGRAQTVYGPIHTWPESADYAARLTESMKVSKNCGTSTGCWSTAPFLNSDGTKYADNSFADLQAFDNKFVTVADGTALAFDCRAGYCRIKVDIDGPNKGKTQYGSDIFDFSINCSGDEEYENVLIPSVYPGYLTGSYKDGNQTAWVIRNENLDYLKCEDELNWGTKTSCK